MNHDTPRDWSILPSVNEVLALPELQGVLAAQGRPLLLAWVREALEACRQLPAEARLGSRADVSAIMAADIASRAAAWERRRFGPVINATGVILHTSLGRAPLSAPAVAALQAAAAASNLEVDLETGSRRERGYQLEDVWRRLTDAEASLVVNNNAAATLLALQALCGGREVILSRGQLIEIGGSFRLPEIFSLSGAVLREVGTTNRTRLDDYAAAIGPGTTALMRVHPSNYRIVGFTDTPEIGPLAALAHERGLVAIDDIGSGSLIDVTRFGLPAEPTFQESLAAGADLVLGSGDKLLGGPQCGILLGRRDLIDKIRRHPLARAVRIDKLTLAALTATLESYLADRADAEIPTLAMLAAPIETLRVRARQLAGCLADAKELKVAVEDDVTPLGGGSLPGAELPTAILTVRHAELSAEELARRLRTGEHRVFPRVRQDVVIIDLRSVAAEADGGIVDAIRSVLLAGARNSSPE